MEIAAELKIADEYFRHGILLYHQSKEIEEFLQVADIWKKALEIYQKLKEEKKAEEVTGYLIRLFKTKTKTKTKIRLDTDFEDVNIQTEVGMRKDLPTEASSAGGRKAESAEKVTKFDEWNLFLKIGCYGFGGPMGVFGLLKEELTERRKVITKKEFMEGAVLGDILPGPVTMDIVTYAGFKLDRWKGAIKATLLFILPSFLLMLLLVSGYDRFSTLPRVKIIFQCLGAAVTGLIVMVGYKMGKDEIVDYFGVGIILWSFLSSLIFKFDIVFIIMCAGFAGIILSHCGWTEFEKWLS